MNSATPGSSWDDSVTPSTLLARNLVWEYGGIAVNVVLGLVMLPFNLAYLGQADYGLWVLVVSVTAYFSLLDLGYGSSQVKFAAQYRARRDERALNEIVSTLFFIFLGVAVIACGAALLLAFHLDSLFALTPQQVTTGKWVLLLVSAQVALGFPMSVFGGLVNGFQRYYQNTIIGTLTAVAVAAANVIVLRSGHGLVELVAVTTGLRALSYVGYCRSAYRAFPPLQVRWRHARWTRLQEITSLSAAFFIIDVAMKVNAAADTIVIGAILGTTAVAAWAVPSRITTTIWMLTRVLARVLFPSIVASATQDDVERMRRLYVEGLRLSLASVVPVTLFVAIIGEPLIVSWVGDRFAGNGSLLWLLGGVVVCQIWAGNSTAVLKAGGQHRLVAVAEVSIAVSNLVLSLALVRPFGLTGIGTGTLIPAAAGTLLVFFPAACRRVNVSCWRALRDAAWPAIWPAVLCGAGLQTTLSVLGPRRLPLALALAVCAATAVYLALFFRAALGPDEHRTYANHLRAAVENTLGPVHRRRSLRGDAAARHQSR